MNRGRKYAFILNLIIFPWITKQSYIFFPYLFPLSPIFLKLSMNNQTILYFLSFFFFLFQPFPQSFHEQINIVFICLPLYLSFSHNSFSHFLHSFYQRYLTEQLSLLAFCLAPKTTLLLSQLLPSIFFPPSIKNH